MLEELDLEKVYYYLILLAEEGRVSGSEVDHASATSQLSGSQYKPMQRVGGKEI